VLPSGKWQWVPTGSLLTTALWQWSGKGQVPPLMLNVDIALVRDLGIKNQLVKATGQPLCTFLFPVVLKCPASALLAKAGVYRENNSAWLADFKKVLLIMVKKGLQ
jgi:hypothetical protein